MKEELIYIYIYIITYNIHIHIIHTARANALFFSPPFLILERTDDVAFVGVSVVAVSFLPTSHCKGLGSPGLSLPRLDSPPLVCCRGPPFEAPVASLPNSCPTGRRVANMVCLACGGPESACSRYCCARGTDNLRQFLEVQRGT